MAVTIKDVARRAGVNASTVSRVLKDSTEISDKTKIKVRKAMQDLGYTRNAAAQVLASGRTNTIGVIFPPVVGKSDQPFFMKILTSINETARKSDISIAIATGHTVSELLRQVTLLHREKRVDGFIMLYAGVDDRVRDYLMANKIPFVLVGTPSENQNKITHVDNDNKLLGREAVRHLADLGHRNIAFVTDTTRGEVFAERYQGFREEMQRRKLVMSLVKFDSNFKVGQETGLVVMDDILSLKVMERLLEVGLSVPEDISIVTYNNSALSTVLHPYLTTFDINVERLGASAVEKIMAQVNHPKETLPEKTIIPFELIVRESTQRVGQFMENAEN